MKHEDMKQEETSLEIKEINEQRIKLEKLDLTPDLSDDSKVTWKTGLHTEFFSELEREFILELGLLEVTLPRNTKAIEALIQEGEHFVKAPFSEKSPEFWDRVLLTGEFESMDPDKFLLEVEARAPFIKRSGSVSHYAKGLAELVHFQANRNKETTEGEAGVVEELQTVEDRNYRRDVHEAAMKHLGYKTEFELDVLAEAEKIKAQALKNQFAEIDRQKTLSIDKLNVQLGEYGERAQARRELHIQANLLYDDIERKGIPAVPRVTWVSQFIYNATSGQQAKNDALILQIKNAVASTMAS